jgi:hypothetical protein
LVKAKSFSGQLEELMWIIILGRKVVLGEKGFIFWEWFRFAFFLIKSPFKASIEALAWFFFWERFVVVRIHSISIFVYQTIPNGLDQTKKVQLFKKITIGKSKFYRVTNFTILLNLFVIEYGRG